MIYHVSLPIDIGLPHSYSAAQRRTFGNLPQALQLLQSAHRGQVRQEEVGTPPVFTFPGATISSM